MVRGDFAKLAGLAKALGHAASPTWRRGLSRQIGEDVLAYVHTRFDKEQDPQGRPWRPRTSFLVKGETFFTRKKGGPSGPILKATGRLARSLKVGRVTSNGFTIGTRVKYARIHQKGGVIKAKGKSLAFKVFGGGGAATIFAKKVTMPKRQFVPEGHSPPELDRAIEETVSRALKKEMPR